MSETIEWKKETVKEREEGWTGWEGEKKGVAVFGVLPLSISFSRRASSTLYLGKKQLGERETRGCRLSQGLVQRANRSTEGSWVITGASIQKSTLSLEKPWAAEAVAFTHTFLTYWPLRARPFTSAPTTTVCKCMRCQGGWNSTAALFYSFTTNTPGQDAREELLSVGMHFKRDVNQKESDRWGDVR